MLGLRTSLLKNALDALKREKSMWCDMEIVDCKVADVKSKVSSVVVGLRQDTFESYASIRNKVGQTLLVVGSRLMNLIDRKFKNYSGVFISLFAMPQMWSRSRLSLPSNLRTEA